MSTSSFDTLISRRITHPNNHELALGAVTEDGIKYINQKLVDCLQISLDYLEKETTEQIQEIKRRNELYFKKPRKGLHHLLNERTVILVDDGAATGATIIAAARWLRMDEIEPKRLIVAVPVAPNSTIVLLEKECGAEVEAIIRAPSMCYSVEQYYHNFQTVSDEEVIEIIKNRSIP